MLAGVITRLIISGLSASLYLHHRGGISTLLLVDSQGYLPTPSIITERRSLSVRYAYSLVSKYGAN